jgi:energy-coupling factor transport system substrate-specific component
MQHALLMWKNTRMIVLTAVCAAIYAATLIAFKTVVPIIPGVTEVRVAGVFPMTFGFLFGPAGAWGLAIGNVIGDIFGGTLSPVSIAGFIGNFLMGYLPYTLWSTLLPVSNGTYAWDASNVRNWLTYIVIAFISGTAAAVIIGTFADAIGMVPYTIISKIITINNFISSLIGVLLLISVFDVTKNQLRLFWPEVMDVSGANPAMKGIIGAWLVAAGCILGVLGCFVPGLSWTVVSWLATCLVMGGSLLL